MADFTALRVAVRTAEATLSQALYQNAATPNQTLLVNAQQNLRTARSTLNAALAASLPAGADAAADLRGDLPIALFPVRIETRFVRSISVTRTVGPNRATTATLGTAEAPPRPAGGQHEDGIDCSSRRDFADPRLPR